MSSAWHSVYRLRPVRSSATKSSKSEILEHQNSRNENANLGEFDEFQLQYLGSQWTMRKSNESRVTNMSGSRRTSCTVGGGKAMARAIIPSSG